MRALAVWLPLTVFIEQLFDPDGENILAALEHNDRIQWVVPGSIRLKHSLK
jgi:hypothetical protein